MHVADMISDLTSLQVCEPKAALALVSARPDGGSNAPNNNDGGAQETDTDLKRAQDLLELHTTVKLAHQDGTDRDLNEAREAVEKVLREI
ncbi:hypothetical protein LTR37_004586 [Vermiconidia calcicola]|uniref:Uncharacterized protein n=1 Tax=Vermiconidia calcicola TaxID=1690605 RepID=A0ACC3NM58_9PEZI|nr:hypothetical protein LTR37_004586 [Vermiconidia calcicola]